MTPPRKYGEQQIRQVLTVMARNGTEIFRQLSKKTPVGIGGRLQRSWSISLPTLENPVLAIGTNSQYFLPLEMGRLPGRGISREGQDSVALWARRKLSLPESEARSFAFLLSRKYKQQGRPATGFTGLASPGSLGEDIPTTLDQTVRGSILHQGYQDLLRDLERIA